MNYIEDEGAQHLANALQTNMVTNIDLVEHIEKEKLESQKWVSRIDSYYGRKTHGKDNRKRQDNVFKHSFYFLCPAMSKRVAISIALRHTHHSCWSVFYIS